MLKLHDLYVPELWIWKGGIKMMEGFTHLNEKGEAIMVDVSEKPDTVREAMATGTIYMGEKCFFKIKSQKIGKGDVLGTARLAGIMGAKKTSELIPLCHILNLTKVELDFSMNEDCSITAYCKAKTVGKTGVEMEALTGVTVALLTIYDMCKAVDKAMKIDEVHLCTKTGGKSRDFVYEG